MADEPYQFLCQTKSWQQGPYEIFRYFYGQRVLDALGAELISPNEIILRPELLK